VSEGARSPSVRNVRGLRAVVVRLSVVMMGDSDSGSGDSGGCGALARRTLTEDRREEEISTPDRYGTPARETVEINNRVVVEY
jgi:hypothetical protein